MTLNRQDKEIVRRKFCAYCIKVMHGEALNYFDELERQRTREVTFSELLQKDMDSLYYCDDYNNYIIISVLHLTQIILEGSFSAHCVHKVKFHC